MLELALATRGAFLQLSELAHDRFGPQANSCRAIEHLSFVHETLMIYSVRSARQCVGLLARRADEACVVYKQRQRVNTSEAVVLSEPTVVPVGFVVHVANFPFIRVARCCRRLLQMILRATSDTRTYTSTRVHVPACTPHAR